MLEENWEERFSPVILSRGYRYFEEGSVVRMKPGEQGWECSVDGSERYSVFVGCDFAESSCDCPYYFDRGFCKHIAAACYEIEYAQSLDGSDDSDSVKRPERPDAIAIARSLGEEVLRAYFIEMLAADEGLRVDFVRRFGDLDATQLRFDLLDGMRSVVREHSCRGFVDYRSAFRCELALSEYLDEFMAPIVDRGDFGMVFDLASQFALGLQKVAIDDSDGFFSSMLGSCAHYWGIAFDGADAQAKQDMFDWASAFIEGDDGDGEDDAGILWYIKDAVEEFACERFSGDAQLAAQMLEISSRVVEREVAEPGTLLAANGATVLRRSTRRLELWERAKIASMGTLGVDRSDIDREIASCPPSLGIIQPLVDEARKGGDVDRAQQLLEQYTDRLAEDVFSTEAHLQLLGIYGETHQDDMRLVTLYALIVQGRPQNDDQLRSWLRKLQKQVGNHWPEYEAELEEVLSDTGRRLHVFLAYTGQLEKLANALESYGSRYEFEQYSDLLAQEYPEKYLAMYESEVRGMLFGQAQQRGVYASAVCRMARMQELLGGDAIVDRLVAELRERYPRRRALMEELDRLS